MLSDIPDVQVPDALLHDYVLGEVSIRDEHRTAVLDADTDVEMSYLELVREASAFAHSLTECRVAPGDMVAIVLPNTATYPVVLYGTLMAGAVATTVNPGASATEMAHQLRDSKAKLLIADESTHETAGRAADGAAIPRDMIISPTLRHRAPAGREDEVRGNPADIAVVPYSSGTTGGPKGVMLTHRNIVANVAQTEGLLGVRSDDTVLAVVPFAHIYGLSLILCTTLRQRARLVPLPRFDLHEYLSAIEVHQCTFLFVSPPIALLLAKDPAVDTYNLSSVHTIFSGAAPLDESLADALARRLSCDVRQGYGMTEASPVTHLVPYNRSDLPRGSVGVLVPDAEQKLIDVSTGDEIDRPSAGTSRPGEILFKGPNVMAGYLGDARATAMVVDDEGFLHTGDIATISAAEAVTIVDRRKELIKVKGYQVAPAELEGLLLRHESIDDVAVTAVVDEGGNERPRAWVVVQSGANLTADEVKTFVGSQVSEYKRLADVQFIDRIPKSGAGKIQRQTLAVRDVRPVSTLIDRSLNYLLGETDETGLDRDAGLISNGFDSLSVIELKNRLSDLGCADVTTRELIGATSLIELSRNLSHRRTSAWAMRQIGEGKDDS